MRIKMSVNQYDLDGNYIRTFDSVYRAEKTLGKCNNSIHHCLHGYAKSAFGYLWRYEEDCPAGEKIDPIYRKPRRGKAVAKYSTAGKFISRYDTIKDAVQEMTLSSSYMTVFRHIKACCERKEQYAYGFIWRYE